ncbi:MAG: protein translocase subunit SecF [Pseudomonadota bacterium]
MPLVKIAPDNPNYDFVKYRFLAFALSALVIFGSLALVAVKSLNFSIDFTGGTLFEVTLEQAPDLSVLRSTLNGLELGSVGVQEFGGPTTLMIRIGQKEGMDQQVIVQSVKDALVQLYPDQKIDYRRVEYVGPQVGDELRFAGALAFGLSMLGIMAYLWWRFEWQFAVGAVVALLHDTIGTLGLFAITRIDFDLATLAAVLMIAGYSLNDTVVVFDRIRENLKKYRKMPLADLLNLSTNQTLSRSLMTSVTTLLALSALLVFGGDVIRGFTYALFFGILIGTFSSIYVAGPVLMYLNVRRNKEDA